MPLKNIGSKFAFLRCGEVAIAQLQECIGLVEPGMILCRCLYPQNGCIDPFIFCHSS